jgi:hypothetical protein
MSAINLIKIARQRAREEVSQVGMRLPMIHGRQGEVPVVGRHETIDVISTSLLKLCSVQFDKQSIGKRYSCPS